MKIVLVASTEAEIKTTIDYLEQKRQVSFAGNSAEFNVLITGVGLVATAYSLGVFLTDNSPELFIHAGIAGAIDKSLQLAEVVQINEDELYDFGAESETNFISAEDMGFAKAEDGYDFQASFYPESEMLNGIKKVSAITVQKVHGATQSISRLKAKNPKAQIETMEAASAWFACNNKGISYIGIRSISNYVEPRNRDSWKIEEAINTLNIFLLKFLEEILSSTSAK